MGSVTGCPTLDRFALREICRHLVVPVPAADGYRHRSHRSAASGRLTHTGLAVVTGVLFATMPSALSLSSVLQRNAAFRTVTPESPVSTALPEAAFEPPGSNSIGSSLSEALRGAPVMILQSSVLSSASPVQHHEWGRSGGTQMYHI
jgi:hypothetical protein